MPRKQAGFTLVEIAIVLVIIGLLLGGVLKGQELITQAKIKNIANDFNATTAAILAYQDRYRKLPGDDNGAAARWTGLNNGTGDGSIGGHIISGGSTDETYYFWQDLRSAGFITGGGTDGTPPLNAAGGVLGVAMGSGSTGGSSSTAVPGLSGVVVCSTGLPGKIAIALDSQFDDGQPGSGSTRGYTYDGTTLTSVAGAYSEDTSTVYTVCRSVL